MKVLRKFFFISVLFSLIAQPLQSLAAPDKVVLTVHYKRLAGDYAGWNLWLWKNSDDNTKEGSDGDATEEMKAQVKTA